MESFVMLGIIDRYANADMIGKRAKVVEIGLAIRQDRKNVSLQKPLKPAWLAELVFSVWGNLLLRCFLPGGMLRNSSLPALVQNWAGAPAGRVSWRECER